MILTDDGIDTLTTGLDTVVSWFRSFVWPLPPAHAYAGPANTLREAHMNTGVVARFTHSSPETAPAVNDPTRVDPHGEEASLSADEQRARVIALRGLSEVREGDYVAAQDTFCEAIRLDPALDLRRLPSFWKLPKPAHETVIAALYDSDRSRDAASLTADLRTRYRPRLLPARRPQ